MKSAETTESEPGSLGLQIDLAETGVMDEY